MMKKNLFKRLRAGFSLIEVNMAIFVLAGGALALLGLFPLGLRESLAARNEMRVAAFAERFINAARVAASDAQNVATVDDLRSALESAPFNFTVSTDAGDADDENAHKDESGVYYRAWVIQDPDWQSEALGDKEIAQVGVQVTAENAQQNKRALLVAPVYVVRVIIEGQQ
jgi:type II secretory pathway pseudopilin PulG